MTASPAETSTTVAEAAADVRPGLPALPAVVVGDVSHSRREQVRHVFKHAVYQWLVDVDDLPRLPWPLRSFATFSAADHLGDPAKSLRENVTHFAAQRGVEVPADAQVLMLANARILGHTFDPLSVFWCLSADGSLICVVAEVHNTYGERHAYLLHPDADGWAITEKQFYVSPFYDVSGTYALRFLLSPGRVATSVVLRRDGKTPFTATFNGTPASATPTALLRQLITKPLMTQRISLLIRMHGIWLWLRRLPVAARPEHARQEGV